VQYVKRVSTDMAKLDDNFSRKETISNECKLKTAHLKHYNPEGEIVNWLKAPLMDWNLGLKLVEEIQKKL